jgi:acyl carrier protein
MDDVRRRLRTFIKRYFLLSHVDSRLADDDSLLEKGLIDASGLQVLAAFIENEFNISVDRSEIVAENLASISRLAAFVRRKQAAAARDRKRSA